MLIDATLCLLEQFGYKVETMTDDCARQSRGDHMYPTRDNIVSGIGLVPAITRVTGFHFTVA